MEQRILRRMEPLHIEPDNLAYINSVISQVITITVPIDIVIAVK